MLIVPIQVNITGSQVLNERDNLELKCTASPSARLAKLTWQKRIVTGDSETVETQFAISRSSISNNRVGSIAQSALVITNVVRSDSGNYICIAENTESDVISHPTSINYTVYVNGNARIYSLIKSININVNTSAAINECERDIPCLNGGLCTDFDPGYFCRCSSNYEGTDCERFVEGIDIKHVIKRSILKQ